MDSLFGVPITLIMLALLGLLALSFASVGLVAWRHPILVRMGLRNIRRRRSQSTLIVVGLMLSTLIISAAFATGDTVGYSITNQFFEELEEIDIVIGFDDDAVVDPEDEHLTDAFVSELRAAFANDPQIDGVTGVLIERVPVLNLGARLSEPDASLVGVDLASVDSFRALRTLNGAHVSASALSGSRAFISESLAREIDAGVGDTVTAFFEGQPAEFQIIEVVRDSSITRELSTIFEPGTPPGGLVVEMSTARAFLHAPGEITFAAVSIEGGVRDALDDSDEVEERIERYLLAHPDANAEILFTKAEAIDLGEQIGSVFVSIFLIFGLFSIAAGILLIFLIFVMLAAERRPEMGMARAIGMRRLHLTESFLAEGMAYNAGSAAVGAGLGLAVAFALIFVLSRTFDEFGLDITFHFNIQGVVIAYSLGVVLTFATVVFSSWRAAGLNIVRAIRDLPEPQPLGGGDRSVRGLLLAAVGALWSLTWVIAWIAVAVLLILAAVRLVVLIVTFGSITAALIPLVIAAILGGLIWLLSRARRWSSAHRSGGGWAVTMLLAGLLLVYMAGWEGLGGVFGGQQFAYSGGVTLAMLAAAMLAVYFDVRAHIAFTVVGLALVWYWLLPLPFSLFRDSASFQTFDPIDGLFRVLGLPRPVEVEGDIEMFFVSGISVTAAGTLVIIFNAVFLLRGVSLLSRFLGSFAPAVRTAVAYPLAAKFRTGMTLAMFGLVVFSLVVMAFLNFNFTQLFLGEEASGGFDVVVDVNPNNRIPDLREALVDEGYAPDGAIAGAGKIVSTFPQIREDRPGREFGRYTLAGLDDEFLDLAKFPMQLRASGFDSDEAVIEALRSDPTVAIVDSTRLRQEGGFVIEDADRFRLDVSAGDLRAAPWEPIPIILRDPGSGEELRLRIIAVLEPQVSAVVQPFLAIFTAEENIERFFNGGEVEHYLVTTTGGSDDDALEVARAIESTLLERGVQAEPIGELIADAAGVSTAFQLLFEAFMGLGLVVGIAALGVIAFRTVVERRQQIGMLRAIGYQRRLIAVSFFLESSFIALAGILMGLTLGSALAYNLLTSPDFTDGAEIDFQVPWIRLALIAGIAYGASALMTLLPARAASHVPVAEALRYE